MSFSNCLLTPDVVKQQLEKRYQSKKYYWLEQHATWQLSISLGLPTEKLAIKYLTETQQWQDTWRNFKTNAKIHWVSRKWALLGTQRLPQKISFTTIEQLLTLINELLQLISKHQIASNDFFTNSGLRREPFLMRIRLLDNTLRHSIAGLCDISAPVNELAQLAIKPKHVFIVENLRTGLAFNDFPNSVVVMQLGYAVELLAQLPWLNDAHCYYWGDIDTHGFNMLNRARALIPQLQSILMDEQTFLYHQKQWVLEQKQHIADDLAELTNDEASLYRHLCQHTWGTRLRLEQERINWAYAWDRISELTQAIDSRHTNIPKKLTDKKI